MRAIATCTSADLGLVDEAEFISEDEALKQIYLEFGLAKPYDDTKPLPPKGQNKYEQGMSYPADRFIIHNGNIIQSNQQTSPDFIESEWDILVVGN